jgi:hypothetical protein
VEEEGVIPLAAAGWASVEAGTAAAAAAGVVVVWAAVVWAAASRARRAAASGVEGVPEASTAPLSCHMRERTAQPQVREEPHMRERTTRRR